MLRLSENSIDWVKRVRPLGNDPRGEEAAFMRGMRYALDRLAAASKIMALADQAIVSCASFLTTIIIARWTNSSELGSYSIGASLMTILIGVQGSLISLPYTIRRNASGMTAEEFAGGSLAQSISFATASFLVIAGVTAIFVGRVSLDAQAMFFALAGAVPFMLLREFIRQIALAHLRLANVLIVDIGTASIQLSLLCSLGLWGKLSAATAWVALGGACAVTGTLWLHHARADFIFRLRQARLAAGQSWRLGRWLLAAHLAASLQRQVTYWLLAGMAGANTTGVFAACMSVVSFANPLIIGLGNVLMPKAVVVFRTLGVKGLLRQTTRDALLLVTAMSLFCGVLGLAGESIMNALYRGEEYERQGATIAVLALALLPYAAGFPACNALMAMERPRPIVWAAMLGVFATIVLAFCLFPLIGLIGAALAVLAGSAVEAGVRWAAFLGNALSSTQIKGSIRAGTE